MVPAELDRLPFPVTTSEAFKFWSSKHVCNRAKACVAFSNNRDQAHRLMRRWLPLFNYHKRERAWLAWQNYVNMPDMERVPFTPLDIPWWDCLPRIPEPPPTGRWATWMDDKDWVDPQADGSPKEWREWLADGEDDPWTTP